ncbi:MAG: protein phosphatase 2C domain-containing protein [Planctomycetota bacterium]|jgi:serine/threonine protein phosphatase PrpC
MWVRTRAFHVAKQGNAEAEYEDAFYPEQGVHREVTAFRCAVADGATESAFSGLWAQLLVRSFGRRRLRVHHLQRVWRRIVKRSSLPWYLEAKLKRGAHAAFVGLSVHDARSASSRPRRAPQAAHAAAAPGDSAPVVVSPGVAVEGPWRALAIGDSCLFHVRDGVLLDSGPVDRSDDFDNSPVLVSSQQTQALARGDLHVHVLTGTWQPHDTFYLATDALAKWILSQHEAGLSPWESLEELGTDAEPAPFADLVADLRSARALHNDDTTLLRIEVV